MGVEHERAGKVAQTRLWGRIESENPARPAIDADVERSNFGHAGKSRGKCTIERTKYDGISVDDDGKVADIESKVRVSGESEDEMKVM